MLRLHHVGVVVAEAAAEDYRRGLGLEVLAVEDYRDAARHANLCFGSAGAVLSKTPGQCPPGAQSVGDRVEMLHVWVFDNPDGAFAHGLTRTSVRAAIKQLSNGQ